jgi:hypothetical protein
LEKEGRVRVLVGNLTGEPQIVTLRGLGRAVSIQVLGEKKIRARPELRISLPPYGIGRIERVVD